MNMVGNAREEQIQLVIEWSRGVVRSNWLHCEWRHSLCARRNDVTDTLSNYIIEVKFILVVYSQLLLLSILKMNLLK